MNIHAPPQPEFTTDEFGSWRSQHPNAPARRMAAGGVGSQTSGSHLPYVGAMDT